MRYLARKEQGVFSLDQQRLRISNNTTTAEKADAERTLDRVVEFFEKSQGYGT